jgi:hypothetical protein
MISDLSRESTHFPSQIVTRTSAVRRLPALDQSRIARAGQRRMCKVCGCEPQLCPLIVEVPLQASRSIEPRLLRTCTLMARFDGPGHMPEEISDLIDRIFSLPAGTEIVLTREGSDGKAVPVASYFRMG